MTEQDKEHTRILFAAFAMNAAIVSKEEWNPAQIWAIADDMIDNMEPTVGLPPIKRKAKNK